MNEKCKYPGCTEAAKKTWALVSLCHTHEKNIRSETEKYYWGPVIKTGVCAAAALYEDSAAHSVEQIMHATR